MALDFYQAMGSGGLNFQTPLQSTAPKQQPARSSSYGSVSGPMSTNAGAVGPRSNVLGVSTVAPPPPQSQGIVGGQSQQPNQSIQMPTAPTPQGPSDQEINDIYNPSMNYLNQAEGQLRTDYGNVLSQAERDFKILETQLGTNKETNLGLIGETENKATQTRDSALSAARRLYDELRRGYQQRFGGATSAGQAASEISSVEQQRQMGQTQQTYGDTVRQIEAQKATLEKEFQNSVTRLQENKMTAMQQAQSEFQNKLLAINNNRTQLESAKAQTRLDALQQLRNSVYQIHLQTFEFERALAQQKQMAEAELQNTYSRFGQQAQESSNTLANAGFNTTPSTNLQTGSNQSPATQGLTGQKSASRKLDEYGRPIYR